MSGSILAAVITPIVIMPILAGWLAVLFYVGSHPLWREHAQSLKYQREQAAPPVLPGHAQPGGAQPLPH